MMIKASNPEWPALRAHLAGKIEQHRLALETILTPEQTNFSRGQIAALRELIAEAEDVAPPATVIPRY